MCSERAPRLRSSLRHSLALRLTAWYASIFAVSSTLAFILVYLLMVSVLEGRTDEDLIDDVDELGALMQAEGLQRVEAEMAAETVGDEAEEVYLRLWSSEGRQLLATDLSAWPPLGVPRPSLLRLGADAEPVLETQPQSQDGHGVRSAYGAIAPGLVLEVGESLREDEEFIGAFLNGFLIMLAAVIILGGPIGWFMARRALSGVHEVTRTAAEIADGALERRVAVRARGDELELLARTFNTMLDRIQALIVGMREMTDNLAHDLRSPLARIRASAETVLTNDASADQCHIEANRTIVECDRLLAMINATLDIAEAQSGAAKLNIADLDLVDLVLDARELFQTVAEDRGITLATDLPATCRIQGDRHRLQRVVANLLDNALKYTPKGGHVTLRLTDSDHRIRLSIEDTGVGISAEAQSRVFERFYRADPSRSEPGNGLGLSLARALAHAHGGDISLQSAPGEGSTFTVALAGSRHAR